MAKTIIHTNENSYVYEIPKENKALQEKLKYAFDWYTLKNVFYDDDRTDYIFKG